METRSMLNAGLTNHDTPDISELCAVKEPIGTWCSSRSCVGGTDHSKKGKFVSMSNVRKCPKCHSKNYLLHDTYSVFATSRLRALLDNDGILRPWDK